MSANVKIPLTKGDKILQYRKKNRAIRHEYYTLSNRHSEMDCYMFTFTTGRGGTYQKLRLINEIKSYVTYLIANSTAEIYFFSNIELGHSLTNPHLHTQLWCNDKNALQVIYEKIIAKFSLDKKRCRLTEPQRSSIHYSYILKDYAEDLNDDRLWQIEQTKRRMRKQLATKLRFYSRSKSKYTSKAYKIVYHVYGVLREHADSFIDFLLDIFFNKDVAPNTPQREVSWFLFLVLFVYRTRGLDCFHFGNSWVLIMDSMSFWMCAPANAPPFCRCREMV